MQRKDEIGSSGEPGGVVEQPGVERKFTSKKVSDHLANERTFLAWVRTGLATMAFGFAVERIGLALRELGVKNQALPDLSVHYSTLMGVALMILGTALLGCALFNFLQIRRAIDREEFHPQAVLPIVLTVLATLIGVILAIYLALTG